MVDITDKPEVLREAVAKGSIKLKRETIALVQKNKIVKGNPLQVAKIAGILAAKRTSELIPLCHHLPLTKVKMEARINDATTIQLLSTVKTKAQTGVEMEALMAVSIGLLTIWDMVKQYEKDKDGQYPSTQIQDIGIVKKVKERKS